MSAIKANGECSKRCRYWLSEDWCNNNPSPFHCAMVWEEKDVLPQRPGPKCVFKDQPNSRQEFPVAKLTLRHAADLQFHEVNALLDWLEDQKKTVMNQRAELSGIFTAKLWGKNVQA